MKRLIVGTFDDWITIYGKACYDGAIVNYNEQYKYYWICVGVFGLDKQIYGYGLNIIISSDSEEFDILTEMIKTHDNKLIEDYANLIIIKYADPKYLYQMIEKVKDVKYKQGRNDVRDELLNTLGIYQR